MKKAARRKHLRIVKPDALAAITDFASLRQQIRDRVGQEAMNMVNSTINTVNDGQYAALKYLFEVVGLFPADALSESSPQDTLAPTLLRALGLPDMSPSEVTKDSGRS